MNYLEGGVIPIKREALINQVEQSFRCLYRKIRNGIHELYGDEVSSNEFLILRFLLLDSSKTVSEISKELDVSLSHITSVSDKLVQKGLIDRDRSSKDRRVVELSITSSGDKLVKLLIMKRKEYMAMKFGNLNDEELEQFNSILKKIMD